MMHFLANEWHQAQSGKRGGGQARIALDALEAEERFALEPRDISKTREMQSWNAGVEPGSDFVTVHFPA